MSQQAVAPVLETEIITLTIDGRAVETPRGSTVLDAARHAGIFIPTLCAHEELSNVGACRLCIVEIEGMRGLPTSCTTPAAEGMVVKTMSPELRETRAATMQWLLARHPNSCMVCDHRTDCEKYRPRPTKAGRSTRCGFCSNRSGCSIRDMVLHAAGVSGDVKPFSLPPTYSMHDVERDDPFMDRDFNLCVLCGRCTRVCSKVQGMPYIGITNRGSRSKVSAAFGKNWLEGGCTFCGACVDICPTGTLTDRYARWHDAAEAASQTTCTLCPEACTVQPLISKGQLVATRMTAFEPEAKLCALGRFALPQVMNAPQRLTRPYIHEETELIPVKWDEALSTIADEFNKYRGAFAVLISESETREVRFLAEKFAREVMNGFTFTVPANVKPSFLETTALPDAIRTGQIKALLSFGDYLSDDLLTKLEFAVLMDFLPGAHFERYHAALPIAVLGEVDGTIRAASGDVKPISAVAQSPDTVRAEWSVLCELAAQLRSDFNYATVADITSEIDNDLAPQAPDKSPKERVANLPQRYRGHLIADLAPALEAMGLPVTPRPVASETTEGFLVLEKHEIVPNFHRLVIEAPAVAQHAKAGQFAIVMPRDSSERVPFTLVDWDAKAGTITLVIEEVGRASREVMELRTGDRVAHVSGPLGLPLPIEKVGTVALGGGCYGVGAIYPIARAMKAAGNRVLAVIEGCSSYMLYMEEELRAVCDEVMIFTKDGSRGQKGGVQEAFLQLHAQHGVDAFVAIGCAFMMRMTAEKTKDAGVPLKVALNPIMVDGTGMCGACRVQVGSDTKFACVDGPFFDGHAVDWDGLFARRNAYTKAEVQALSQNARATINGSSGHQCKGTCTPRK